MQLFQIPDVKDFMNKLLTTDLFDTFLVSEATITTFTTFEIDGSFHGDYFSTDEAMADSTAPLQYSPWKLLRPLTFQLIKGKNTPLNLKIVFRLADHNTQKLLEQSGISLNPSDISGLFLNITYNGKEITCTTGIALRIFTMDKSLDHAWDTMVQKFFRQKEIPYLES